MNRLTTAVATGNSAYNLTYSYTADGSNGQYGNMTCSGGAGLCTQMQFDASNNRVTMIGNTTIPANSYDQAGEMLTDSAGMGTHTCTRDAEGKMTTAATSGPENGFPLHAFAGAGPARG